MSARSNGSSNEEQPGIRPSSRRGFGCVTWVYMGILVFLAVAFLLWLALRYAGGEEVFGYTLPRLSFLGLVLIVPGMVLGAVLGTRTYRAERRRATRVGAGVGALIGWSGFFALDWFAAALDLNRRDEAFRTVAFPNLAGSLAYYAFVPLTLVATVLVIYALYSKKADFERRRGLALVGAALALVAGLLIIGTDFDISGVIGALMSTISAALGGYVSGSGYARAGGDDMIPPGATIRRKEPRRKPR